MALSNRMLLVRAGNVSNRTRIREEAKVGRPQELCVKSLQPFCSLALNRVLRRAECAAARVLGKTNRVAHCALRYVSICDSRLRVSQPHLSALRFRVSQV